MKLSYKISALALVALASFSACKKKPVENTTPPTTTATSNEMHFMFEDYFGDKELVLNTGTYTNLQNEQLNVTTFNYWITNIKLIKADGTEFTEQESYRLLRANKPATHHFHIKDVPAGTYTGVKFIIGVDIPRNTAGAQTGELDPTVNGDMYWSWQTGYIQAKLEGTSPVSPMADKSFMYHIGGIQAGNETPREVTLNIPNNVVVGEKAGSLTIKADAAKWFGPSTTLSIAAMPSSTHGGGTMSAKIADNYKSMFTVTSAVNE